jgi:hypothetical protein
MLMDTVLETALVLDSADRETQLLDFILGRGFKCVSLYTMWNVYVITYIEYYKKQTLTHE